MRHLYKYNPYSVTMVLAGQRDVVFDTGRQDWNPCRAYSVNATIMDQLGMIITQPGRPLACGLVT